ncbi:MAG: hypothetical protein Q7S40_04760, partial [Opitutaceae bacterium]|nr:hypothetical protein [Opitutaceae bacterium]
MRASTLILSFFVLLFVLHQDYWWRDDPRLVLGVLPVSLAYHIFWTLLVAFGWWLVTRFTWPHELDDEALGARPPPVALPDA